MNLTLKTIAYLTLEIDVVAYKIWKVVITIRKFIDRKKVKKLKIACIEK